MIRHLSFDILVKRIKHLKEPVAILITVALLFFGLGATAGGYVGLPDRVNTLENDVTAIVCLLVMAEEDRDSRLCYLLMSDDTREFVNSAREGFYPSGDVNLLH